MGMRVLAELSMPGAISKFIYLVSLSGDYSQKFYHITKTEVPRFFIYHATVADDGLSILHHRLDITHHARTVTCFHSTEGLRYTNKPWTVLPLDHSMSENKGFPSK